MVAAKYNAMWTERSNWAAAQTQWDANSSYKKDHWVTYQHVIYSPKADWPAGNPPPPQDIAHWNVEADVTKAEPDVLGDSPGHVVHAYQALFDADTAAAEFDRYYANQEGIADLHSQAGSTYYLIHSIRQMGQQDFTAHTSSPLSSVYHNAATGQYSVLAYNPSTSQQNVTVYQNGSAVGTFAIPAQTLIDSHLDQTLTRLTLAPSNPALTIEPGQTVQFTLTGYDQYGATYPLAPINWSASAGGTISESGLLTATTNAYPATVTASSGGLSQTYTLRVGLAPVLTSINVTPGFSRVILGDTAQYNAAGLDQYGDPFVLGPVDWAVSSDGVIDRTGQFTANLVGAGEVTATSGTVSGSALVAVHTALGIYPSTVAVNPVNASVSVGQQQAFTAHAFDDNFDGGPAVAMWSVSGGGAMDASGAFTATSAGGPYTVTANFAGVTGTAGVNVTAPQSSLFNAALHQQVTASSSENGGTLPGNAVDGRMDTRWSSGSTDGEWFQVDLGSSLPLSQVVLHWENAYGKQYDLLGSNDGANWTRLAPTQTNGQGGVETSEVSGTFRFVKLQGIQRATQYGYSLWELQVLASSVPQRVNKALNRMATSSSSENGGTLAANVTDGDLTSRWSSGFTDDQWITVDLGAPTALSQVALLWENAYAKQYDLLGSNDGVNWTELKPTQANGQGGIETIAVSGTFQFVRMQGRQRATRYGYSLWEFQVY